MSRGIKFRAWLINEDRMVNWNKLWLELEDGYGGVFEMCGRREDTTSDFELMQYTGLKDKNGVEIYEGDIVLEKIGFGTESRIPKGKPHVFVKGVVDWSDDGCWFISHKYNNDQYWKSVQGNATDWYRVHFGWNTVEVIGNIYENPDLIKDGESA